MRLTPILGIGLGLSVVFSVPAQADFFDKLEDMMDRVTDRAEKKAEDKINKTADDAVDDVFESTEEAVECAVTDKECQDKEKQKSSAPKKVKNPQKPKTAPTVQTESASTSMKCVMTDVACLKEAKSLGKQVEIVDEADLNVLRCTVTDVKCLRKAQRLGKPVEIID